MHFPTGHISFRRCFFVAVIVVLSFLGVVNLLAQDTLKIATYNILNYPGSDAATRNPYFRRVIHTMAPDVLVVQEITSQSGVDGFRQNVLNAYQSGLYTSVPFHDGPDTDNSFFFKSSRLTYLGATYIGTALRDIAEYRFKSVASSDTIRFYSLHLKASSGADNETLRLAEATILRNYLNALPTGAKFIIGGDYNIYRSTEPAFQKLVGSEANNNGRCKDPLNANGIWNNNSTFRFIHTQSTRSSAGGLDDRFDMLLNSYSIEANLLASSYTPYGNDGAHFNLSINQLPNYAVPDSVANGLYYASDHLPVSALYVFQTGPVLSPEPTVQAANLQISTVTSTSMSLSWTNGNGANRIVVARAGSAVSFVPTDGQSYSANSDFTLAPDLGSGNKAVYSGSGNSVTVAGLAANTTYHFAVYEFNGSSGTENYFTTLPPTNNATTLSVTYYSQGNLPPDVLSSWNSQRNGAGSSPANFTSGVPFVIQDGDTMTTTAPWTVSGTGNRIQIESGGVLQANHLINTSTFQVDNGGMYIHSTPGSSANGAAADVPGSTTRLFGPSSTVQFNKWANLGTSPVALPSGVSWGNLIINVDTLGGSWQQSGALAAVMGNITIQKTGGGTREFRLNANVPATSTLNLDGDLSVSGGIFNVTSGNAVETFNLGGNFSQTGGTFTATGAGPHSLTFTGGYSSATFASSGGTFTSTNINWTIGPDKSLVLDNNLAVAGSRTLTINGILSCGTNAVTGAGAVVLSAGATLGLGSVDGINLGTSLGNIRVSGSRTFGGAANYIFNGASAQISGNGFPSTVNDLAIDNSGGVALTGSVTINGSLSLASGTLSIGSNTLTLNGDINQTSGALTGGTSSNISFGGAGVGALLPAVSLQNLTINRPDGISLAGPVSIFGALTLSSGAISTGVDIITLGPTATISEAVENPVMGTVTTTRAVIQSVNNTFGGLGIELNAAGASPGSTVVTRETGISSSGNEHDSILRYFDISPTVTSGLNATLVFHYDPSELNGNTAAILRLWKSTDEGMTWEFVGGVVDTNARTMTVTGVQSLPVQVRWTGADTLHPLSGPLTQYYSVLEGWNLISVPRTVSNYRRDSLFQTSVSNAYRFIGGTPPVGYVPCDTLANKIGYWLKFPSPQEVPITGEARWRDTIGVLAGWNMIGTITDSVGIGSIVQSPPNIVASPFFWFNSGYINSQVLVQSRGYWVKVSENGTLVLRSALEAATPTGRKEFLK